MNDPHVDWLLYSIEHDVSVDYSKADPVDHEETAFCVRIEMDRVRFTMKEHHATERAACAAVKSFIDRWVFQAQLQRGPNTFTLRFLSAHVVDRAPNPTPAGMVPLSVSMRAGTPTIRMSLTVVCGYPAPPSSRIEITPNVRSMYERYLGYRDGREPLPAMAYFCLTVLESEAGAGVSRRAWAASRYGITKNVLQKMGELSSGKGGGLARKAEGHRLGN